MNKIFKVKRNALGQSVVCSEKTKTQGKVKSLVTALTSAVAVLVSHDATAATIATTPGNMFINQQDYLLIGNNVSLSQDGNNAGWGRNIVIGSDSGAHDVIRSISIGHGNIIGSPDTVGQPNHYVEAMAFGHNNKASPQTMAFGSNSIANGAFSIAIGQLVDGNTTSVGFGSIAIGGGANATGSNIDTNRKTATAIGFFSHATGDSVAIGSRSVTGNTTNVGSAIVNNITYGTFAAPFAHSAFSIGNANHNRQIQNVAAGRVTATSTDGINGSQLYAVANNLGNLANSVKTELGGNAVLAANGTITMSNIGGTGQNNIHDAISFVNNKTLATASVEAVAAGEGIAVTNATVNGVNTYTVSVSETTLANITKAQTTADKAVADIKALDDIAVKYDSTAKNMVTLGGADGTTITNVKDGAITADSKDAVNGSQLYALTEVVNNLPSTGINAGEGIVVTPLLEGNKTTYTVALDDATKAQIAKEESVSAGTNIIVTQDKTNDTGGKNFNVSLNSTLTGIEKIGGQGTNITFNGDNISVGGVTITDVKTPVNATDAANKQYVDTAISGLNLGSTEAVAAGEGIAVTNASVNGVNTYTVSVSETTLANITKAQTTADKAVADIKALDDIAVKYDSTAKNMVTLGGADGTTITNVKDGAITADSKDAVNGSQLYALTEVVNNLPSTGINAGEGIAVTNATVNGVNTYTVSVSETTLANITKAQTTADKANATANQATADIAKGFNVATSDGVTTNYQLGDTVVIGGGHNINTTTKDGKIVVALANDIAVDSITINGSDVGITANGINAGEKPIQNVADGRVSPSSKDAINGSQLYALGNKLNSKIDTVNKDAQAGTASAVATASLPQAVAAGRSMIAASSGHYKNASAIALGYSRVSDSGKFILKLNTSANTRGDFTVGTGIGYQW